MIDLRRALTGGSGGALELLDDRVRKHAAPGLKSLADEARWLRDVRALLPPDLRSHVPMVISATPETIVLERVPGQSARSLAVHGSADRAARLASRGVDFIHPGVFLLERSMQTGWIGEWYCHQVDERLELARRCRPQLCDVLDAEYVTLGRGATANPFSARGLRGLRAALGTIEVPLAGLVHGDLHLGNLVVADDGGFAWLDPRGRFGTSRCFDAAYDVAKLLHELHYVAVRSKAVNATIERSGNVCRLVVCGAAPTDALAGLGRISCDLAVRVCRRYLLGDPGCAARATLLTGLLFLTVLPFGVLDEGEWQAMLAFSLAWLRAGLDAVHGRYGLGRCRELWVLLLSTCIPVTAEGAAVDLRRAMELGR